MTNFLKWLASLVLLIALLALGGLYALHRWTASDDFRVRVEKEASAALGVPVSLRAVLVDVWPVPAIALDGLVVQSRPQLTLERVEARPVWSALVQRRLAIATLLIRKATLPQQGIDAVLATMQQRRQSVTPRPQSGEPAPVQWLGGRTVLDEVTWVSPRGLPTTLDADARWSPDGLPEKVSIKIVKGAWIGTQALLDRSASGWILDLEIGGGSVTGPLQLQLPVGGRPSQEYVFGGQLETRGVEVSALTSPARVLTGKLEASSMLSAKAGSLAGLIDAMQTATRFTVRGATVHGLDLAKAVSSVGLNRGGQTALDQLSGELNTQGRAAQVSKLVASSGVLTVRGAVSISATRTLGGQVDVALVGGVVGVPLALGGTLDAPTVNLSRSALVGAVLGTTVLPGAGTAAGAKLGDRIGQGLNKLFGR